MLKDERQFREWWAEEGRLIDAPGAMAQRIMFAEKIWQAANAEDKLTLLLRDKLRKEVPL